MGADSWVLNHHVLGCCDQAFLRWVEYVDNIHNYRLILKRAINKMRFKAVTLAWEAWLGAIEERKLNEAYGRRDALEEEVRKPSFSALPHVVGCSPGPSLLPLVSVVVSSSRSLHTLLRAFPGSFPA